MTDYTFRYYKINGRASGIKYFLDYLNLPFKDEELEFKQFQEIVENSPIHDSPMLIVKDNEFFLPGTIAIYHYLAAKHGGLPKSIYDQAVCDAFASLVEDFMFRMHRLNEAIFESKTYHEIYDAHNSAMKFFCQNLIPILAKQISKNESGFLMKNEVTWVDFMVAAASANINMCEATDMIQNHTKWMKTVDKNALEIVASHQCKIFELANNEEKIAKRDKNGEKKEKSPNQQNVCQN